MQRKTLIFILAVSVIFAVGVLLRGLHRKQSRHFCRDFGIPAESLSVKIPPKDYTNWRALYGSGEPDTSTEEGLSRLREEDAKLPNARKNLMHILSGLPAVYTNLDDNAVKDFLSCVEGVLCGFDRAHCQEVLTLIEAGGNHIGLHLDDILRQHKEDRKTFDSILFRYCEIFNRFADLLWERAGQEFAAADADLRTYHVLNHCIKTMPEEKERISPFIEKWKLDRCDNENSNLCRSHLMCEDMFERYYKESVGKNPKAIKPLSNWYRWHLTWAQSILRREPVWSPCAGLKNAHEVIGK